MITEFDKSGFAAHYKSEFARCLDRGDYESAIDYVLKYAAVKDFPDLHLALGMLYLRLTDDSDDIELCCMAYREFMLHIRRFPDCERAYRDLLIAVHFRCDLRQVYECCRWIEARGIDLSKIISELENGGIVLGAPKDDPIDFDGVFAPGEYGEIDPDSPLPDDVANGGNADRKNNDGFTAFADGRRTKVSDSGNDAAHDENKKVIAFRGLDANAEQSHECKHTASSVISFSQDKNSSGDSFTEDDEAVLGSDSREIKRFLDSVFDDILIGPEKQGDGKSGADGIDELDILKKFSDDDDDSDVAMRLSELYYERGDNKKALEELNKIKKDDELYYYALAMRALVYLDGGNENEAEQVLDEALEIKPNGALATTLICKLYEKQNRTYKIPALIKQVDIKDFMDGDHVYEAFKLVIKYSSQSDAIKLIKEYIDEYNILDIRLVYAQLMYNLGDRTFAVNELYKLSRIFYDEYNIGYFYSQAKLGVNMLPVDLEAPQEVLTEKVEGFMNAVLKGGPDDGMLNDPETALILEFFISLEFKNEPRLLKRMFRTVQALAADDRLSEKMLDALVSPYVEPIVKAVILSEILIKDHDSPYLLEIMYSPLSDDCSSKPEGEYSAGVYRAFAYMLALCRYSIDKFCAFVKITTKKLEGKVYDESALAYLLIRGGWAILRDEPLDPRVVYALGFSSKAAAERDYKGLLEIINNSD